MTTSEQIRVLCVRSGVSLSELARRINQTPQNFSVKLKRNTVTQDELFHPRICCIDRHWLYY